MADQIRGRDAEDREHDASGEAIEGQWEGDGEQRDVPEPEHRARGRRWIWIVVVLCVLIFAYNLIADRLTPYTSQATVQAYVVGIAPEIAGNIIAVQVKDNQRVAQAEREGRLRDKIRFFCRAALLIVDEIGYLPVTPGGGNLFFQLVNARYEKGAMNLTSNRGFAEWGEVFGDAVVATALLDRLLHHAVVIQIEGASYRLRHHAELLPEHIRSKAVIAPPLPATAPARQAAQAQRSRSSHRLIGRAHRHVGKFTSALLRKVRSALTRPTCWLSRTPNSGRAARSTPRSRDRPGPTSGGAST